MKTLTAKELNSLPAKIAGPGYDRTSLTPGILHVGVGNFHRAHMAHYLDRLFEMGKAHDWAIIGAGVREGDARMRQSLLAQDCLTTVVELDPSGLSARVIGSMIDFVQIDPSVTIAAMCDPAIRIVSMTITEGGYYVDAKTNGFDAAHPDMVADAATPGDPKSVFGMIIAALKLRRAAGVPPFTVMSCDNLPENGHVAKRTIVGLARMSDAEMAGWIEANVAFPSSMVDCITPATSDRERSMVADTFGLVDSVPVVCEPFRQWVLEDNFPLGRPPVELVGAEFVENVAEYELMKLRILNGGHAAIAYAGALFGHHFVHDAMADPRVRNWLDALIKREIIPTLRPIDGVDYQRYREKIVERFSNPRIGDTIPRLCLDGSNRQPKFILPTLADALRSGGAVDGLALEVALWCRYCAGTTDAGAPIEVNDESKVDLQSRALEAKTRPAAFLENTTVFGELGKDPRFAAAFSAALASLWDKGAEATLTAFAG